MPEESRYNGSGAPGVFLEDLLGATAGGHDIPDAVGWELKWHSDRTSLVTLFHKSPDGPEAILRYMGADTGARTSRGAQASDIPSRGVLTASESIQQRGRWLSGHRRGTGRCLIGATIT